MVAKLKGRRIFITGVSRGIGLASARLFLSEGADVIGVARDEERLESVREELRELAPGRIDTFALDVIDADAPTRAYERIKARWNALDILFNNAGAMLSETQSFEHEPAGTLEETLEVNLIAPFQLSMALLPLLRRGNEPRIVHVSSGAGTLEALREPKIASYRLSKWSLNGLTQLQAAQLTGQVAVNALDPGWVRTDLGGPNAPGAPEDSARGALALLEQPFSTTGKFFKDGREIPW
jgi:NAD(P)-dependent dehydrogenase (short-subunit alcohol dehydrogenase family)